MFTYLRTHNFVRYGLELLLIALVTAAVMGLQARPGASQAGQHVGDITMLPATLPVDLRIEKRAAELLASKASAIGVWRYVVTNTTRRGNYVIVSLAGLPEDLPAQWNLDQAVYLGSVTLTDPAVDPSMPGIVDDALGSNQIQSDQRQAETGRGGAGYILPWRSGTVATYGTLGVHNCGFSLNGWKAVDLFPTENQVYAAAAGEVSYVCRDGNQVGLRIGDTLYDHLADTGQQVGDRYEQGQSLGSLIPGSFNTACGYAEQQPAAFHVHFCFIPDPAGSFQADGYTLNMSNSNWTNGAVTVTPGQTLTANWANANIQAPGPTAGGNFWDGLASGLTGFVSKIVPSLPQHAALGYADKVTAASTPALKLMYVLVFSVIDMTIPIFVVMTILTLETARLIYSAYMWVKRAIPVIG